MVCVCAQTPIPAHLEVDTSYTESDEASLDEELVELRESIIKVPLHPSSLPIAGVAHLVNVFMWTGSSSTTPVVVNQGAVQQAVASISKDRCSHR